MSGWRLAAAAALIVCVPAGVSLGAHTAHFGGAVVTLGSGFVTPPGVAVDWSGNVYVANNGNSAVKEIVAVNGRIPASPVINTLGSGVAITLVATPHPLVRREDGLLKPAVWF